MTYPKKNQVNSPAKIQDFLNTLVFNFEEQGETLSTPYVTIERGSAHCFEGALVGAYFLSQLGHKPLIMYLKSTKHDNDHVIALFRVNGYWGALSKTNHAVLRYREPVYKTIRELAMSYFHEYFLNDGTKTLRSYSDPLDIALFEDWVQGDGDLWGIDEELDRMPCHDIVPKKHAGKLRLADPIEREAGAIIENKAILTI
jgi:hypothetical protein